MRRETGALRALTVLLASLLPVAIVFGLFYFTYVRSRQAYITERNYRALATASRQIEARFEGIAAALKTAVTSPRVNGLPEPAPNLTFVESFDFQVQQVFEFEQSVFETCVYLTTQEDTPSFYFRHSRKLPTAENSRPLDCKFDNGNDSIYAKSNLQELFSPLRDLDLFDDVILAYRPENRIIYQRESHAGPIVDLRSLLENIQQVAQSKSAGSVSSATAKRDETKDQVQSKNTESISHQLWEVFSQPPTVWHLGTEYKLFLTSAALPLISIHINGTAGAGDWLVAGLVRERHLTSEAWALSPTLLTFLIVLLVIVVLMWPLLKLWYMGPSERLRGVDVRVLVVSCLLAVGLLTFVILDTFAYRTFIAAFDEEMEKLGVEIESRFQTELVEMYTALQSLTDEIEAARQRECGSEECGQELVKKIAQSLRRPSVVYRSLTNLLWVGASGTPRAVWKLKVSPRTSDGAPGTWTIDQQTVPDITLQDRRYFIAAQAGRLWNFCPQLSDCTETGAKPLRFAVEVVQARTTGATTIAMAVPLLQRKEGEKRDVALIGSRFPLLVQPVLPPSLGFAIIDEAGNVLLHSDAKRNLHENLFQECDNDGPLRFAVFARRVQYLDTQYYGQGHRLYVQPLRDTSWSLIIFRNKHFLREAHLALVLSWVLMTGLYVGLCVGFLLVLQLLSPGYRAEWAWPDRAYTRAYWEAAGIVVLVAAACFTAVWAGNALSTAVMIGAVPPLTVALLYLKLNQGRSTPVRYRVYAVATVVVTCVLAVSLAADTGEWRNAVWFLVVLSIGVMFTFRKFAPRARGHGGKTTFRAAYVSMMFVLLVVMAVVPTWLLFRDAYRQTTEAIVKLSQISFAHALEKRAERLQREQVDSHLPSWARQEQFRYSRDVYDFSFAELESAPGRKKRACTRQNSLAIDKETQVSQTATGERSTHSPLWSYLLCGSPHGETCLEMLPLIGQHFSALFLQILSTYHQSGQYFGAVIYDTASDEAWCWKPMRRDDEHYGLRFHFLQPLVAPLGSELNDESRIPLVLTGMVPRHRLLNDPRWVGIVLLAGIGLVATVFGALWSVGRRLFLLDCAVPHSPTSLPKEQFWMQWLQSTPAEKLAMRQLAEEGFMNPNNPDVVRRLGERQLIWRGPALLLVNERFRRFVLRAESRQTIAEWEGEGGENRWARLRVPLLIMFLVVVGLLFITQRELYTVTIGLIGALTAAVPVLMRLFGVFNGQHGGTRTGS